MTVVRSRGGSSKRRRFVLFALFLGIGVLALLNKSIVFRGHGDATSSSTGYREQMKRHTMREHTVVASTAKKARGDEEEEEQPQEVEEVLKQKKQLEKAKDALEAMARGEEVFFICPNANGRDMSQTLPTDFGECNFELTSDLEYLPARQYLEAVERRPPAQWRKDARAIIERIEKIQHPSDCSDPDSEDKRRWHLVKLIQAGLGFNVYLFTDVVARHWESGLAVMPNMNNKWRFSDLNCGRGYTCHLRNLTTCDIEAIPLSKLVAIVHHGTPFPTLETYCVNGKFNVKKGRCACKKGYMPFEAGQGDAGCIKPRSERDTVPSRNEALNANLPWALAAPGEVDTGGSGCPHAFPSLYKERYKYGFFWWHSVHLDYLIRGSTHYPRLEKWAVDRGLDHKNGKSCIAIHVRHGDACMDGYSRHRTCHQWDEYAEKIKVLEKRYGKQSTIFIATDDEKVIDDAKTKNTDHRLVFQDMSREKYQPKGWGDTIDVRSDLDDPDVTTEFFRDVVGMSMCGMFVGTFTSSIAWMVVELQASRMGHYRPFIALDMPYAAQKNVGRFLTWQDEPNPSVKRFDT